METWIKNNKVCFVLILIVVLVGLGALFNWVIYPDSCYLKAIPLEAYDDDGNPDTTSVYSMENVCERHRFTEELLLEYQKDMQNPEIIDDCVTVDGEDKCAVDIEEPVVEEPTYEILEWTGYMGCIGGCEDGSDEEYVEGYYYRYTNPELGLRITTPSGDGGNYNVGFRIKRETPIFKLVDNTIYSLEYDYASNWSISDAEFIKVYDKDPSISLENLLKEQYQNCRIEKVESSNLRNFHGFGAYFYDVKSDRGLRENNCNAREEGEGGSLVFYVESKDENKYYKVGVNDGCAPGPCSIFGNVEAL